MRSDVPVRRRNPVNWWRALYRSLIGSTVTTTLAAFFFWGKAVLMANGKSWGEFGGILAAFSVVTLLSTWALWENKHHEWEHHAQ